MNDRALLNRITLNPAIMTGKPTVRNFRITVEQILKSLAAGVKEQELLEEYPELEPADIRAVLLYASELVSDEKVYEMGAGLCHQKVAPSSS